MKVLIFGFPRSGTSLTYRIFKKHKDISRLYFETLLLWRHKDKKIENLFDGLKLNQGGGEKIIYEREFLGKQKKNKYIEYCDWWNERFKDESRIIQVIRHPYDQWNSIIKKKYIAKNNEKAIIRMLKEYFKCVPKNIELVDKYPNSFTFKLENLIYNTEDVLNKLYTHCGLDIDRTKFNEKMRRGKAFNYKRLGFEIDNNKRVKKYSDEFWAIMNENVPELIEIMNKFEGPKYEI